MITFSELLTRAIKDSKYMPEQVAELCSVHRYTLKAWSEGIQVPERQYLRRLANILCPKTPSEAYWIMFNMIRMEQGWLK